MGLIENFNQRNDLYSELDILKKTLGESKDKNPDTLELNGYNVTDYGSYFSIDINDLYGLTMKKVDGEVVFDAKHEGFFSRGDMDLTDEETIDNGNIDMINRYLKSIGEKLITDESDIQVLNSLFEKMDKAAE